MAAIATARLVVELDGLLKPVSFPVGWATTTTPTKYIQARQVMGVADTAEALDIGDITTPLLVVLTCVTNDVDIDCNYSSSFSADITVNEGEAAVFMPAGTTWIKNNDAAEVSTIEYLVLGTQKGWVNYIPTYTYRCLKCGMVFDYIESISHRNNTQECPSCKGPAERNIEQELVGRTEGNSDHPRWSWSIGCTAEQAKDVIREHPELEHDFRHGKDGGPLKVYNRQDKLRKMKLFGMTEY